ncbi:hypothetical protein B0W48_09340 [Pseudoalteromonas aliena]|uniref:HTH marR-type domain-containing protein n=1 Tax=Pseudoalteromonas aliena TaxID=247523 RepID=A0A1Q2GY82_9GAMM|nr:hypothetical protein [Pseudoalteromonas aliena]AQP99970.1 hypothetical protein B0W48_09340 [Pseudoalteromonas aliena]
MTRVKSPQFGAVLFRSTELISTHGVEVFERLGIGLHANKISIVLALHTRGALSSTELSKHIGISRQLIESRLKSSVKDGFFIALPDLDDSRRRIYNISASAKVEAERIVSIMLDFEQVYAALWDEIGIDIEVAIKLMEKVLNKKSLFHRLLEEFPDYEVQVKE